MTIANSTSSSPTVRFTGDGFTFNRPMVLDVGTGTALLLASYNTNGNQVFNGVISGAGAVQRRSSNGSLGNTLLSGQNTYNGGTLLRQGGIGFGSDTISTTPPAIGSGAFSVTNAVSPAPPARFFLLHVP